MQFETANGVLIARNGGEMLRIEPWGKNSLRVRATMLPELSNQDWALTETPESSHAEVECHEVDHWVGDGTIDKRESASITNGRICAVVNFAGVITFYRDGRQFLREYYRSYDGTLSRESRCLKTVNREWKGIIGGSEFSLNLKFDSNDGEKIFGMGQYQQPYMDLKGCTLELAQRNSQISVPFAVSNLGYGMLWNNPAVGQVTFGKNYTEWTARSTKQMDYWLTVADGPKQILENYTAVTGRAPMFPEDRMGLWQCKLRYRTQDEVLSVARQYQKEGIHIDQIVIDFFHWTVQGDWKFDTTYWPDPKAMVDELHSIGIKVIVSVWPSVDRKSENFQPMMDRGLLIRTERGAAQTYDYQGDCVEIDVFNPETRKYVWEICKKNYYDFGIDAFWLDNSEPDYGVYDFDHYRYIAGPALSCSNIYPQLYSRVFYDNMKDLGDGNVVNLLRCAWAGSQKYGNVVWSGDVPSTFEAFYDQLQAGLNMGLAGIPWWTTDIGGFHGGDPKDPKFSGYHQQWLFSNVPSSSLLFLRTFVLLHHSCIIFQLFCRIQENLAVVFRHPFRPFSRFFLFQHIFNKNTVSFCRILYKHMRYSSDQFSILNDGTPAHPLNNAPCLFQQFRICHLNYHSFVHLVGFFVNLCYTDCVFFHLTINVAANPCLSRLYFLFFCYLYRNFLSYPASV